MFSLCAVSKCWANAVADPRSWTHMGQRKPSLSRGDSWSPITPAIYHLSYTKKHDQPWSYCTSWKDCVNAVSTTEKTLCTTPRGRGRMSEKPVYATSVTWDSLVHVPGSIMLSNEQTAVTQQSLKYIGIKKDHLIVKYRVIYHVFLNISVAGR